MIRRILRASVIVLLPAMAHAETFKPVTFPGGPRQAIKLF